MPRVFTRGCLAVVALLVGGCQRIGSCEAMSAHGLQTGCSGPEGWLWNGATCVFTQACNCTGADCQGLFADRETCEMAHTHCAK